MYSLVADNLCKRFGARTVLSDISFNLKTGESLAVAGCNGAGKTTLFNLITGFYRPDAGEIIFQDYRIDGLQPHRIFQNRIYRTFQITREFSLLTVLENLMLIPAFQAGENVWNTWFRPSLVRRQEADIRNKALEVLAFVELIELKDEYAGSLSGGQKKLLELARSMMADPKLVLLDEPGAGVNPTLLRKLMHNIKKLNSERQITFLLIEHDMDLVMNLCNPVIVMSEGRKLAEGTPEQIKSDEKVLEAYLGGQYR
jgi:branched-chain amino acid transport system ATP-binding protein